MAMRENIGFCIKQIKFWFGDPENRAKLPDLEAKNLNLLLTKY
jgi:hypothetical protein